MEVCSIEIKKATKKLVTDIKSPVIANEDAFNSYAGKLYELANQGNAGSPADIAVTLFGSMALTTRKDRNAFLALDTHEEKKSFLKQATIRDADEVYKEMSSLGNIRSLSDLEKAIKQTIVVESTLTGTSQPLYSNEARPEDLETGSILLNAEQQVSGVVTVDRAETNLLKSKAERNEMTKDLKKGGNNNWLSFLTVYFPGQHELGREFTEWARDHFYDIFLDTSQTKGGFKKDIGTEIANIKERLRANKNIYKKFTYGDTDEDFLRAITSPDGIKDAKLRYFNDVLLLDFDFILDNLIKLVSLDNRATVKKNKKLINVMMGGVELEPILINLTNTKGNKNKLNAFFSEVEGEKNTYEIKGATNNELIEVSSTVLDFLQNTQHQNNKLYRISEDGSLYYRAADGTNILLDAKKVYDYNRSSKRNTDSIDHYVNPLGSNTEFLNNLFPLFKIIDPNGNLGERMTISDFNALSTLLSDASNDVEEFAARLLEMSNDTNKNSVRIASIARTLHAYVFSKVPVHGVHSIRMAGNSEVFRSVNHDIVAALHSSLISKDYVQLFKDEEGVARVTKGANKGTESAVINERLSNYLMSDKYTKGHIANKLIRVGKELNVIIEETKIPLSQITTLDPQSNSIGLKDVARALNLEELLDGIHTSYTALYDIVGAEENTIDSFKKILLVAGYNKKIGRMPLPKNIAKIMVDGNFTHEEYMHVPPSMVITAEDQRQLASVFFVDTSKSQKVGSVSMQATTTKNKNTTSAKQARKAKEYNETVSDVDQSHNAFIKDSTKHREDADRRRKLRNKKELTEEEKAFLAEEESYIVPAQVGDVVVKAPILFDGEIIKLSDWNVKIRLENAMINGFLTATKSPGKEFYLQVVNYSDKSSPELHQVFTDENLLSTSGGVKNRLKKAYIEYNVRKNESLQRVMINSFREYIVGDYENIVRQIKEEVTDPVEQDVRLTALLELKQKLAGTDWNAETGDMTRGLNDILKRVRLNPEIIKHSNADLDLDADYTSFWDDSDALFLKPTAGIRAKIYRDPKMASKLVESYLKSNRDLLNGRSTTGSKLDDYKVNTKRIKAILKGKKGITSDVNDFFDRFFLINGIYGHSLKTITMGDETYFTGKFGGTIDSYYEDADAKIDSNNILEIAEAGIKESETMLNGQFKRAQSVLSRGVVYASNKTLVGIKRASNRNNLLQHLDIYKGMSGTGSDIYRFKGLEGNTYNELWGKGVIVPIQDDVLYTRYLGKTYVKFNIGGEIITVNDNMSTAERAELLNSTTVDDNLLDAIEDLLQNRINDVDNALSPTQIAGLNTFMQVGREQSRAHALRLRDFKNHEEALVERQNGGVVMPDFIPSILITDPSSYINLLNKMNVDQENSDAIQYIHPLLHLIRMNARGNSIGAFNTENYEAVKTVGTTVDYAKMRQSLQKNSGQMPFSVAQIKKTGSIELFNMLKNLNTAIDFKQPNMSYTTKNRAGINVTRNITAKNLDELFTQFDGYGKKGDAAWNEVLEVLRQNPTNMYSFVGLVNVPSNQKTGQKKLNNFDKAFSKTTTDITEDSRGFVNTTDFNIDYSENEFIFEILTKAHEYDVSGSMNSRASIALLSQLVNATAFGGLSNVTTTNLQNAMGELMGINRLRVGKDLALIATKFQEIEGGKDVDYKKIIDRFMKGDVATDGYTPEQKAIYDQVLRKGVYSMAQLAFNENMDSVLIKNIIEGEQYSLDTPAVQNKVMGTLRAAFFGDTVKMRMDGFQAVVSTTYKTINMYTFNGKRASRQGFIAAALNAGEQYNWKNEDDGQLVNLLQVTDQELDSYTSMIIPYDDVKVVYTNKNGEEESEIIPYWQAKKFIDNAGTPTRSGRVYTKVLAVITPDAVYDPSIDNVKKYNAYNDNTLIRVKTGLNSSKVYYKWYLDEIRTPSEIKEMIKKGEIEEDIVEKYMLRWSKIYRKAGNKEIDIKDTDAYRDFYRISLSKKTTEKQFEEARAVLIAETQRKDGEGNSVWSMDPAEVVLPSFLKAGFNLPNEIALHDLLEHGASVKQQQAALLKNLKKYNPQNKSKFRKLQGGEHYSEQLTRIYKKMAITNPAPWITKIMNILVNEEKAYVDAIVKSDPSINRHDVKLSSATMKFINDSISEAYELHMAKKADSFWEMLEVALTRIPGQSKQSGFTARIVEFLDAQGNGAFAPTEHIVTTGGDYDIDTLSVLTKSLDREGILHSPKEFVVDNGILDTQKFRAEYDREIKEASANVDSYIRSYNQSVLSYIERLEQELEAERQKPGGGHQNQLFKLAKRIENNNKSLIDTDNKGDIEEIKAKVIQGIHAKYEKILANAVAISIMDNLNNIDTAVELNTPISMGMFDAIIEKIEETQPQRKAFGISGETFWPIFLYEELAAQGKEAIGMYATVLKINSAIQAAKMEYDRRTDVEKERFDNPFYFDHSITFTRKVIDTKNKEAIDKVKADLKTNENAIRDLSERLEEASLKAAEAKPEENEYFFILEKMPKMLYEDLIYETGLRGGTTKDIPLYYVGKKGKGETVDEAAHQVWMAMSPEMKKSWDTGRIKNEIIDFVQKPYVENRNLYTGELDAKGLQEELTERNKEREELKAELVRLKNLPKTRKEKVTKTRHTFADLDRFNISGKVATEQEVQKKLNNLMQKGEQFDNESVDFLVDILTKEMTHSINTATNTVEPFSEEQKQDLLDAFGGPGVKFDEEFIYFLLGKLSGEGNKNNEVDQDFLEDLGVIFEDPAISVNKKTSGIRKDLNSYLVYNTVEKRKIFKTTVSNLYGLDINEFIKTNEDKKSPIKALEKYLTENPNVVEGIFIRVVGKQLSNDVQSQFLSAATDNAKELILGKIRASSLTNPVITTMMTLGYDTDDIIDFLYDPEVEKILIAYAEEKGELRRVTLNPKDVRAKAKSMSESVKSLISILEIGKAINKFKNLRSLMENNKVEQAALDKILGDLASNNLYSSIKTNKIDAIALEKGKPNAKNKTRKVFNPEEMIFYHIQSRNLFNNIYESENYKMNSLFNTVGETKAQGRDARDENGYKNIRTNIAGLKVEAFLNNRGYTGIVPHQNEDGSFDRSQFLPYRLDDPNNRELFLEEFPKYIEYAKTKIKGNYGLESLRSVKSYGATKSVLAFPKLKAANVDPVEIDLIHDGINSLKNTKDLDPEMARFKKEVYSNLALYALIVSKGEVRKGSMIEVFDKINYDLAEFLSTLDKAYYAQNFRPENKLTQDLISGNIDSKGSLEDSSFTRRMSIEGQDDMDIEDDGRYDDAQDAAEAQEALEQGEQGGEVDEEGRARPRNTYDASAYLTSNITSVVRGEDYTVGRGFRILDKKIGNAIFYTPIENAIAYRLFDIVPNQALPQTSNPEIRSIDTLKDLAKAGKQIGYRIDYNGHPAWIVAYSGRQTGPHKVHRDHSIPYEEYIVFTQGEEKRIPGAFLMGQNKDLFLKGNIISPLLNRYMPYYEYSKGENKNILMNLDEGAIQASYKRTINKKVDKVFTQDEINNDPIISREANIIGSITTTVFKLPNTALDVLYNNNIGLKKYSTTSEFFSASSVSRHQMVPSVAITKSPSGQSLEEIKIIPSLKERILTNISSLSLGETTTFVGLKLDSTIDKPMMGGMSILEEAISQTMDSGGNNNTFTLANGTFSVQREIKTNEATRSSYIEVKITRENNDNHLVPVTANNKQEIYTVSVDKNGFRIVGDTVYDISNRKSPKKISSKGKIMEDSRNQALISSVFENYVDTEHKRFSTTLGDQKVDFITVNRKTQSGVETDYYARAKDDFGNNRYYNLITSKKKDFEGFEFNTNFMKLEVSKDVKATIVKESKKAIPVNTKCN